MKSCLTRTFEDANSPELWSSFTVSSSCLSTPDDGGVRIWKNFTEGKPELVTAWQALSSLLPSTSGNGSGLVVNWEQQTGLLMASGDVRHIRLWDTQREIKLQVYMYVYMYVERNIFFHPCPRHSSSYLA